MSFTLCQFATLRFPLLPKERVRVRSRLLGVLLPVVALAGCTTGRQGASNAAPTAEAKTLRIARSSEPDTLDPVKTTQLNTFELLSDCYEPLVAYGEQNEIAPSLAEKWEVSADGKTYTFHLRKGVTFHNGQPFTAADVKYSFERALWPSTASPLASTYLGDIRGAEEVLAGKRKDLPSVKIVDDFTLQVTIEGPRPYFLAKLTQQAGYIVCKSATERNGHKVNETASVGTGPFTLEDYQPGRYVALKAYPGYWGGRPGLERIEVPILLNPDTQYANFETGQVDIAPGNAQRYAQDRAAGKFRSEYRVLPTTNVAWLAMNRRVQPAFAKKEVRQAFAMAINRDECHRVGMKEVGTVQRGLLANGVPGAEPPPPPIPYDPKKAQELLAKAGYPGGKGFPTISLTISQNSPTAKANAQIVRANLQDSLDITVEIQERESAQFFQEVRRQSLEFYFQDWTDYADPHAYLTTSFSSGSKQNYSGYRSPAFDALCAQADAEPNPPRRAALYAQANRQIVEDVGALPFIVTPRIVLISDRVKGWRANLIGLMPNIKTTKAAP